MSDLIENHIVGFPTRRLNCCFSHAVALFYVPVEHGVLAVLGSYNDCLSTDGGPARRMSRVRPYCRRRRQKDPPVRLGHHHAGV